jgi:DNA uptake protein ComE-like DNA-binding protein
MENPTLDRYRNSEFLQYMKDVLELVNTQDVDVLQITTQRDALATLATQMDYLFQQEKSSGITQELIELDARRDKAFMGIKANLEAYNYHFDTQMQAAARSLLYNLNNYGTNIPRMNYQAETAIIDSMLSDWETETDLINAVTTAGLNTWVAELKTANEAFNNRYLARVSESAANPATSFTAVREVVTDAYKTLTAHVEAHATLGSNTAHQELVNEFSILAKQYNQTVGLRLNSTEESSDTESSSASDSEDIGNTTL